MTIFFKGCQFGLIVRVATNPGVGFSKWAKIPENYPFLRKEIKISVPCSGAAVPVKELLKYAVICLG